MKHLNVRMDDLTYKAFRTKCSAEDVNMTQWVIQKIEEWMGGAQHPGEIWGRSSGAAPHVETSGLEAGSGAPVAGDIPASVGSVEESPTQPTPPVDAAPESRKSRKASRGA